jgi:SAM-dependent methyltransferase
MSLASRFRELRTLLNAICGNGLRSDTQPHHAAGAYDRGVLRPVSTGGGVTTAAFVTLGFVLSSVFLFGPSGTVAARGGQILAPYVPTPEDVVERMLAMAGTTKNDLVYDLGCGDGRIPIAAAKTYGARGVGIDIDPKRIEESRANARAAGVDHLVEFRLGDVLLADVSPATVVTLYMLGSGNAALRPVLTRQLRPGARIVSHAFSMGPTWPADKVNNFTSARGDEVTLYFWKADGKIRP